MLTNTFGSPGLQRPFHQKQPEQRNSKVASAIVGGAKQTSPRNQLCENAIHRGLKHRKDSGKWSGRTRKTGGRSRKESPISVILAAHVTVPTRQGNTDSVGTSGMGARNGRMVAKSEPQIWPPHVTGQIPHLPTCMSSTVGRGREVEFEESKSIREKPRFIGRFPKEIFVFGCDLDHTVC